MNILNTNNKLSSDTQEVLVTYGLLRQTAKENAPKYSGEGPEYFGLHETANEYKLLFTEDLTDLDRHPEMELAIVAPDNQTFDLLAPKDYAKKITLKDEKSIRSYLRKLLDSI